MAIEVNGRLLETNNDGYLQDLNDWSADVAQAMARADRCELTPDHWEVINFLRAYYVEYRIAPPVRRLVKEMGERLGADKGNSRYLYRLFPDGPAKQACRYAGLPSPTGCI